MRKRHIIKLALVSLLQRGIRSWITVLGVVIGIGAIISLMSISQGAMESVTGELEGFGADIITISPGFQRASGFSGGGGRMPGGFYRTSSSPTTVLEDKDLTVIRGVDGVKVASPSISGSGDMKYLNEESSHTIYGVDPLTWPEVLTTELAEGRFMGPSELNAVVIGNGVATEVFEEEIHLMDQIEIEGRIFKVVGILEESGMFGNTDRSVYMTMEAAVNLLEREKGEYSTVTVKVKDNGNLDEKVEQVMADLDSSLMLSRNVNDRTKDFTVTSTASMTSRITDISSTFNMLLAGIAAISLLVGALGIANNIYMSVIERTKQIGLMKSLGSTDYEILKLFLFESAVIGFLGGLMGVFLGFIISGLIAGVGNIGLPMIGRGGFNPKISNELIFFSILFSVIIGVIAGLLPAKKAASLQPVEAFRYE